MHLLPRYTFDGLRVRLQCLVLLLQLPVFLLKLVDLLAEALHFLLLAALSLDAVWPEYLVKEQGGANKDKDVHNVAA